MMPKRSQRRITALGIALSVVVAAGCGTNDDKARKPLVVDGNASISTRTPWSSANAPTLHKNGEAERLRRSLAADGGSPAAASTNGRYLLLSYPQGVRKVWDIDTMKPISQLSSLDPMGLVTLSDDGRLIAYTMADWVFVITNRGDRVGGFNTKAGVHGADLLKISPDDRWIYFHGGSDGLYNIPRRTMTPFDGENGAYVGSKVPQAGFSADSRNLITGGFGSFSVRNVDAPRTPIRIVHCGCVSPPGAQATVSTDGRNVFFTEFGRQDGYLWDVTTGREVTHFKTNYSFQPLPFRLADGLLVNIGTTEADKNFLEVFRGDGTVIRREIIPKTVIDGSIAYPTYLIHGLVIIQTRDRFYAPTGLKNPHYFQVS